MNSRKKNFIAGIAMSISLSVFTLTSSVFAAPITISQAAQNAQKIKSYNFDGGMTVAVKPVTTATTDANAAMAAAMFSNFSLTFNGKVDQKNPADVKQYLDIKANVAGMAVDVPMYGEGDLAGTKGTFFIGIPEILKTLLSTQPSTTGTPINLGNAKMGYIDIADLRKFILQNNKDAKNVLTPANLAKSKAVGQELYGALLNYVNAYTTNKANKNITFSVLDKKTSEKVGGVYKVTLNALQLKAFVDGLLDDKGFQKAYADFMVAEKAMVPTLDTTQMALNKADIDKEFIASSADLKNFTTTLMITIKNYNIAGFNATFANGSDKVTFSTNVYNINGPVSIVMPKKDATTIDLIKVFGNTIVTAAQQAQKTLPAPTTKK